MQTGQWLASVIAAGIAFSLLGTPLVDGPVSRASEHASDAYAREVGVGRELARALVTVQSGSTAAETAAERRPELVERGRDRRWRRRSRRRRSAGPSRRRRHDGDAVGIAPRQPCRLRRPPRAEVGVDLGEPAVGGHPFNIAPGAAGERLIERRPSPALGVSQQLGAAGHLRVETSTTRTWMPTCGRWRQGDVGPANFIPDLLAGVMRRGGVGLLVLATARAPGLAACGMGGRRLTPSAAAQAWSAGLSSMRPPAGTHHLAATSSMASTTVRRRLDVRANWRNSYRGSQVELQPLPARTPSAGT